DPHARRRLRRDPHVRLEQSARPDLEAPVAERLEHVAVHRPAGERLAPQELPVDADAVPRERVALVVAPFLRPQPELIVHRGQLGRRYGLSMGSAEVQGELWSTNPAAWAEGAERKNQPLFEAVLDHLDPRPGTALLDAGCGSGLFAE